MANIRDVAEKAGVSVTTVSHVLNKSRRVSKELSVKVLAAAKELNYQPNTLARGLRLGQTKTLGLIIPDILNPFFAEASRAIEDVGYSNGYSLIVCNSDLDNDKEKNYINTLISKQVDGVIFISSNSSVENVKEMVNRGITVVLFDRLLDDLLFDNITLDNVEGGYIATKHLISLMHRDIACIMGPLRPTLSSERINGYRKAMNEIGLEINNEHIIRGDFKIPSGYQAMQDLLRSKNPPTAVFACNDLMAIGAIYAIFEAGLQIPRDISIVGFDNIDLSSSLFPPLTTIDHDLKEMAQRMIKIFTDRTHDEEKLLKSPISHVIKPRLVIRESTGPILENGGKKNIKLKSDVS